MFSTLLLAVGNEVCYRGLEAGFVPCSAEDFAVCFSDKYEKVNVFVERESLCCSCAGNAAAVCLFLSF